MFCPSCGTALQAGQKFCTECGANVVAAATQAMPSAVDPTPAAGAALPRCRLPSRPPHLAPAYDATTAFTVVEQTSHGAAVAAGGVGGVDPSAAVAADGGWPMVATTGEQPVVGPQPFRVTPLVVVAFLAGVVGIAAAVLDFVSSKDVASGVGQTLVMNDLGTSHLVGAVIGAVLMILGAVLGAQGRRVGTGLAGGAGLALAGMLANACGIGTVAWDSALKVGEATGTEVTATFEIGFFLAVGAAVLGGLAFLLSLKDMGADGRPPVPPAIGGLGVLGAVAVAVGTLLPVGDFASFSDNFEMSAVPPAFTLARLLVLVLIVAGGVLGFLVNRRWGLGLALGSISVGAWMWATAVGKAGDIPFGIAGGSPGTSPLEPAPHLVTTIGVVVMVVAALVGLIAASQQRAGQ